MNSWRRQRGGNYNHEATRTRSQSRKPPLGSWQPTVPSWEKKFCTSVGSVSWRKIVETKKFMHLYDNVVKWNDSAGREAFHNAKNRFYARINGLPCDISLPDPDIYIDEIDWNSKADPELLLDLEHQFVVPAFDGKDDHVVIFDSTLLTNHGFSVNGWGESEDDIKRATNLSKDNNDSPWEQKCGQDEAAMKVSGWGDLGNNGWFSNENENNGAVNATGWENLDNDSWGCWNGGDKATGDSGWGYHWSDSLDRGQYDNNYEAENWKDSGLDKVWGTWNANNNSCGWDQYQNNYEAENWKDRSPGKVWGTGDVNNRKGTGRYIPRYKTSRFRDDNYHRNNGWRSWKEGERGNFVPEQAPMDKRPSLRQWNLINSYGPVNQHA